MSALVSTGKKTLRDLADSVLVFAFKRGTTKPDTPGPSEVAPAGWTLNAIPTGTAQVWVTTARFDSRGNLVTPWEPVELAGTNELSQPTKDAISDVTPIYRGAVTERPTSTSHKGDWVLFTTSLTTGAGDAQIEVFNGVDSWTVEDPPSAYHVNAATGDILKRAGFRDQGTGSYSPIKSFDFLINLFSQYIKVSGSLRVGDRYDETGTVIDPEANGAFLSPTTLKVRGITFDGPQGSVALNNPGGFTTDEFCFADKGFMTDRGILSPPWPDTETWGPSLFTGVLYPKLSWVQAQTTVTLKPYSWSLGALKISGKRMTGSPGVFEIFVDPEWTPTVGVVFNRSGLTFSFNATTGVLTWGTTDTVRLIILGPF